MTLLGIFLLCPNSFTLFNSRYVPTVFLTGPLHAPLDVRQVPPLLRAFWSGRKYRAHPPRPLNPGGVSNTSSRSARSSPRVVRGWMTHPGHRHPDTCGHRCALPTPVKGASSQVSGQVLCRSNLCETTHRFFIEQSRWQRLPAGWRDWTKGIVVLAVLHEVVVKQVE